MKVVADFLTKRKCNWVPTKSIFIIFNIWFYKYNIKL